MPGMQLALLSTSKALLYLSTEITPGVTTQYYKRRPPTPPPQWPADKRSQWKEWCRYYFSLTRINRSKCSIVQVYYYCSHVFTLRLGCIFPEYRSLNIGNRSIVHASSERVREKFDWNCLVSNTYSYHLIERNVFAIASNNIEWNIENQTTNSWKYQTNIINRTHFFPYRIQLLENIECNIRRIKQLFLSHTLFFIIA